VKRPDLTAHGELAVQWLLNSGIRSVNPVTGHCAFYEAYRTDARRHTFRYCESTGYAVSFLLNMHGRTGDTVCLEAARQAGEFLLAHQCSAGPLRGAFPWCVDEGGSPHSLHYSFDTGVCLQGLLALCERTGDQRFGDAAIEAASWLCGQALAGGGRVMSVSCSTSGAFEPELLRGVWSGDGGCLHVKLTGALLHCHEHTGSGVFLEGARRIANWSRVIQNDDGSFPAFQGASSVFTHGHCYAVEGLISAWGRTGDEGTAEQVKRAACWLLRMQNRDGSFFDHYGLPPFISRLPGRPGILKRLAAAFGTVDSQGLVRIRRTDATAQAVRIMLFAHLLTGGEEFMVAALKACRFLAGMQHTGPGASVRGGVSHARWGTGPSPVSRRSCLLPSWTAMFCAEALHATVLAESGELSLEGLVDDLF